MSEITPDDLGRPADKDEQQTILQNPSQEANPLLTGIQAVSSAPRLEVGPIPLTRVAEYELLKEIGRGGMGVVFKARHVRLNRIVALKMIRGGTLANSEERQRFEKEASAAAQLQHPNIVALYEVSPYNEQPFLSMEYIGGTSLAERLSLGPLSGRRAAEYLEITARAVHYAHTRGIVHRDLKPANVLLDENDQPKVTDFGLAKQMETESDQTRTGAILGTPSYMSPEQAAGSKAISPASDVYSLGAILYELVTGKPPFCGETPLKTLNLVAEQDPIPPRVLTPSVDRDLETICLKCLEKTAARRYGSAESLADDLRRYLHGEPITARRLSWVGRGVKWIRRNRGWAGLIAASALFFGALMTYLSYVAYEEKDLREQADKAKELAGVRLNTMRHLLYLSEMRQAQQALRRADYDGGLRILNKHLKPREAGPDMRDWEWYFLKDRAENRLAFGSHAGQAFAVDYRPDGKQLASAGMAAPRKPGERPNCEIKLWDVRTGTLVMTLPGHAEVITAVAYHPTKPILASASFDQNIKLWNLDTGNEIITLQGHTKAVYHVAFSPKGDRIASASHDLSVRVWDYERYAREPDQSVRKFTGHDLPVTAVAFHPDVDLADDPAPQKGPRKNQYLASGSSDRPKRTGGRDHSIKLWNLDTGQLVRNLVGHQGDVSSLAFGAGGKTLVSGGGLADQQGEVLFWDVDSGQVRVSRTGLSDRITHISVSRDDKVAAAGADGLLRIWNNIASSEALTLRGDPQMIQSVAFAPDGFSFASAGRSGRISLWNSSAGSETLTLSAPGSMKTVAFDPKGPYLAAAGPAHGQIHIWNLENPEEHFVVKGHRRGIGSVAFSPDGAHIASAGEHQEDHTVRIVDFRSRDKEPIVITDHRTAVHAVAYRPDGSLIASAGEDEVIHLHDPATGKLIKSSVPHKNGILCLAFSPDGRWLASGTWNGTVRLWDLDADQTYELNGHTGPVNALAFRAAAENDGLVLASGSNDRSIRIWDVANRKQSFQLEGTPGEVLSLAFHPHGGRIVSIGSDRLIRVWDIVTRQEILDFEEHVGTLRRVAFSADGRSLAGAGNGVVRVWQASKEMLNR